MKRPDDFKGTDLTSPINRIPPGRVALAVNARAYQSGAFKLRNGLSAPILTIDSSVQSICRLNDTTPAGPVSGFTIISGDTSGQIYNNDSPVARGLSGNPVSIVPFRPDASVQPWAYIGDNAPFPNVIVDSSYACAGMIKVRSDGLSRKMGIIEPQTAPVVSTSGSTTTGTDALPATTIPWTNVGGANGTYNYGHTSAGDGTSPVIISTPVGSQTLTLVVTGSATVNGATHAPGDTGPATSTFPATYTGGGPKIVLGAFTDGAGNVLTGTSPVPLLANVGAGVTLQVPAGAANFQIGIDSAANTFSANSGSFSVAWTLVVSAIATKVSTLGVVTAYYWGDSPHSGPVAEYIWKNPNDVGTGTPRSIGDAVGNVSNNSWQFHSTPADGTVPVQWDSLDSSGTVTGSIVLFSPALESEGFQDFNACIVGSLFFPAAGTYSLTFINKDQIMVGIGGGVTVSGGFVINTSRGQTMSVVSGLPLVYSSTPSGGGGAVTQTIVITVPGTGTYQVEIDWDYWEHTGRIFTMTCNSVVIPPLPQGVRTNVSYAYKYRASETGAQSNPSPESSPQLTPVLDNTVTPVFSPDPQVDKVDYYRQDAGLANFTYVATGPNTNPPTSIVDSLSDLAAADNATMNFDDFEPVPSIGLPQGGVVNVSGGIITWVSGNQFNIRWLGGTVILIGSPTQLAYSAVRRPSSVTLWDFTGASPEVLDGTNLAYNIAEPILAAQPLAYIWGPTDNINYAFGVGDPNRPGTLYWSKGSNLDSWPDTNQQDVTDPSEALVNGAMSEGLGVVFSIKRAWVIVPNFFNALATATGTSGSTWSLQATGINRGLFIPRCVDVEGGGLIFFRVDDGIDLSIAGSPSQSITNDDLYPLFPHEGSTPVAVVRNGVTIFPPDDTQPERQKFKIVKGYLYYDYLSADNVARTLVYDVAAKGWVWDVYSSPVTARASNEGESQQGVLTGGADGTIRQLVSNGVEAPTVMVLTPAIGGQGFESAYEYTVEYSSVSTVTLTSIAADVNNGSYGPAAVTLPSTGGQATKFTFKVSPNKWKFLWFQFHSTDAQMAIYLEGFVIQAKAWGSNRPFAPIRPFGNSGGEGAQS